MSIQVTGRRTNHVKAVALGGLLAVGAFVLGLSAVYWGPALQKQLFRAKMEHAVPGPSASWSIMLSLAQQEAAKLDRDAFPDFYFVHAVPVEEYEGDPDLEPSYSGTLSLVFDFIRPSVGS